MKNHLFILLTIMCSTLLTSKAQTALTFEEVVQCDKSLSEKDLYSKSQDWVILNYNSDGNIMQLLDPVDFKIICTGSFYYSDPGSNSEAASGRIEYSLSLYFKDGRYKYVFSNFIHKGNVASNSFGLITNSDVFQGKIPLSGKKWRAKIWNDIKSKIRHRVSSQAKSLENYIKKRNGDGW